MEDKTPLGHIRLDPIVASFRLFATTNYQSRLIPNDISLEILSGLFYLEQETEVTISVVLDDGRRLLITNPNEIQIISSNTSIVAVDGNKVIGKSEGHVTLTVNWVVCSNVLITEEVDLIVEIDRFRPVFNPDSGNATVPEDSPVGFVLTTVTATDEDAIDIHTDIRYNIQNDPYNGLFVVDDVSGVVYLNGPLDRELQDVYEIIIEATDSVQRQQLDCVPSTVLPTTVSPTTKPPTASGSGLDSISGSGEEKPTPGNTTCPLVDPISTFRVSWMDGWMNGWIDGWMDGWMNGRTDGWMDG